MYEQKSTFGINKPFLGRLKSTETVYLCYGKSSASRADLVYYVMSSKHRSVTSKGLVFLSMQLYFIYINIFMNY